MKSFNDKNYLVFAGTSTIAKKLIKILKDFNTNVFFTSRDEHKASLIKEEFGYKYEICDDLSNFENVQKIFHSTKNHFNKIDGIINFAGSILIKPAHQTSYDEYFDVISKNLTTNFAITKYAASYMPHGGSVVFISSIAATVGISNHEAISLAKSGIEGLVRSAACTYATQNIRFNCVSPSLTDTNLSKSITKNEMMLKISKKMHALGRIGKADDIARACSFLLNPDNNWITGQILNVDGGFSLKSKITI